MPRAGREQMRACWDGSDLGGTVVLFVSHLPSRTLGAVELAHTALAR